MSVADLKAKLEEREQILNKPEPDSFIWRYYPIDKFLNLLTSGQLFFTQASSFHDPFESDYGSMAKQQIREQYGEEQYLRDFNTFEFLRQHTYISCWHENEHESDAMWKLYGNAIAVKAKLSSISKLLSWSETEIKYYGRVNYIDFATEHVNVESSYLQEHRHDWNAYPTPEPGKTLQLSINDDFEEIVFSPTVEPYVADSIAQVIRQAGISIAMRRSILLNSPVW